MPRLRPISARDELPPEHQAIWDRIGARRGHVIGPFGMLLQSPPLAGLTADLGAYIRFDSGLEPADRELAILTVAREMDCSFEWAYHVKEGRRAGVRDEAIDSVRHRRLPGGLTSEEEAVVRYVRQLLTAHHSDPQTFEALRSRLGERGLVELTATLGYYTMLACTLNAFEILPPAGEELLPA